MFKKEQGNEVNSWSREKGGRERHEVTAGQTITDQLWQVLRASLQSVSLTQRMQCKILSSPTHVVIELLQLKKNTKGGSIGRRDTVKEAIPDMTVMLRLAHYRDVALRVQDGACMLNMSGSLGARTASC